MSAQDPKFDFSDNRIYHHHDGTAIPEDEPVVVMRGKDEVARLAVAYYIHVMQQYPDNRLAREHAESMQERLAAFTRFQEEHPERTGMGCHTCDHVTHRVRLDGLPEPAVAPFAEAPAS